MDRCPEKFVSNPDRTVRGSYLKTGKPSTEGGWTEYSLENNENTFFISQNGDSDVTLENRQGFEVSKALQFWDTEWNWEWNPFLINE